MDFRALFVNCSVVLIFTLSGMWSVKSVALQWGGSGFSLGSSSGYFFGSLISSVQFKGTNENGTFLITQYIFDSEVSYICDNPKDKNTYQAESARQTFTLYDLLSPTDFSGNGQSTAEFKLDFEDPKQVIFDCHQKRFNYVPETAIIVDFYILVTAQKCQDFDCSKLSGKELAGELYCKFPLDVELIRDPSSGVIDPVYKGTEYQCTEIYLPD